MSVSLQVRRLLTAPLRQCALVACYFSLLIAGSLSAPVARAEEQSEKAQAADTEKAALEAEARAKITKLTEQLAKKPDDVDALVARSAAYRTVGEIEKEQVDANEAVRLAPKSADAWQAVGAVHLVKNENKEAISAFEKAIELGAKSPEVYRDLGMTYYSSGDHKNAISAFTKVIELKPDRHDAYMSRAMSLKAEGDTEKVLSDLNRAIELAPRQIAYRYARIRELFDRNEIDLAIEEIKEVLSFAPKRDDAWLSLGEFYAWQHKYNEAIPAFDKAIELEPENLTAYSRRGLAYQQLNDHKSAIASFTTAIEKSPDWHDGHFARAISLKAIGEADKALAESSRAIEMAPDRCDYRIFRAELLFDRKDFEHGAEDISAVIRRTPGDVGAAYQPNDDKELSAEALAHGNAQVAQMLKDRPEMAKHVTKGDKLWTWAARKFAGEDTGELVDWNPSSPAPFEGFSTFSIPGRRASIRVGMNDDGKYDLTPKSFDRLWSIAVFELHNVANSEQWGQGSQQVAENKLDRDHFVLATLNTEQPTTERTRAFYVAFYLPWLQSKGIADTTPHNWIVDRGYRTDDLKTDLKAWGDDPRIARYYVMYDLQRAEQEFHQCNYGKVKELVRPHLTVSESVSPEQASVAHYWLGCAEGALNNLDECVKEFTAALALAPGDVQVLMDRGKINSYRQRFDEALADFSAAADADPKLSEAYLMRGYEYLRRGNLDAALQDAQKTLELDAQADGYLLRGWVWEAKNELPKAVDDFSKAIELSPEHNEAHRSRARVHSSQEQYEKCLADLEVLLRQNPQDDAALNNRGWILHVEKKSDKAALADISRAIELNPSNSYAFSNRARLLLTCEDATLRNVDLGLEDAKKSCELTEWKDSGHLALLAQGYAAKKDWGNALKWQKKALENLNPERKADWEKTLSEFEERAKGATDSPAKDAKSP